MKGTTVPYTLVGAGMRTCEVLSRQHECFRVLDLMVRAEVTSLVRQNLEHKSPPVVVAVSFRPG